MKIRCKIPRTDFCLQEGEVDIPFPTRSSKYNEKSWTLYTNKCKKTMKGGDKKLDQLGTLEHEE